MKPLVCLSFVFLAFMATSGVDAKKKKKSKVAAPVDDAKMFDSKTLKCLVCRNLMNEFDAAIYKIDPKKVIDTGTYRVNEKGERAKKIVSIWTFFRQTSH